MWIGRSAVGSAMQLHTAAITGPPRPISLLGTVMMMMQTTPCQAGSTPSPCRYGPNAARLRPQLCDLPGCHASWPNTGSVPTNNVSIHCQSCFWCGAHLKGLGEASADSTGTVL